MMDKPIEIDMQNPREHFDEDGSVVRYEDDGSILIDPNPMPEEKYADGGWFENIANRIDNGTLFSLGAAMVEDYENDVESRADWEGVARKALEHLGVKPLKTGNYELTGACTLNMPVIGEIATQFQARAMEELFPSGGPAKSTVVGDDDEQRTQQADRVAEYTNYFLTEVDSDYMDDSDQMLFKVSLFGSMFRQTVLNFDTGEPEQRHRDPFDVVVPYKAKSLIKASRISVRDEMHVDDIIRAQEDGFYADVPIERSSINLDENYTDEADRKTPGRQNDGINDTLTVYKRIDLSMYDDSAEGSEPYVFVVDRTSRVVLRAQRNWDEKDEKHEPIQSISHWKYLPGLGFYGFGLLHYLGPMGEAATESMRALFDAATMSSFPGGFKKKGVGPSGDVHLTRGVFKEIDFDMDEEIPLESAFSSLPINQPAPALYQAFKEIVDTTRRFGSVTEILIGEGAQTGPVGTTLAKIEQALKLMSGIHKRLHKSLRDDLRILQRVMRDTVPQEGYPYIVQGEDRSVMAQDFDDRVDVLPVSDPNIFSSVQRIAMAQAMLELVESAPDLYGEKGRKRAHRAVLIALKHPDVDEYLSEESGPPSLDPVSENMMFMTGMPSKVVPAQNHQAHMAVHQHFLQSKVAGLPPEVANQVTMVVMAHLQEHMAYEYQIEMSNAAGRPFPPMMIEDMDEDMPIAMDEELSVAAAQAVQQIPLPPPPEDAEAAEEARIAAQKEEAEKQEWAAKMAREESAHEAKIEREQEESAEKAVTEKLKQDQITAKINQEKEAHQLSVKERNQKLAHEAEKHRQKMMQDQESFEKDQSRKSTEAFAKSDEAEDAKLAELNAALEQAQGTLEQLKSANDGDKETSDQANIASVISSLEAAISAMAKPKTKTVSLDYGDNGDIVGGTVSESNSE